MILVVALDSKLTTRTPRTVRVVTFRVVVFVSK
jgi:hypothetical protein